MWEFNFPPYDLRDYANWDDKDEADDINVILNIEHVPTQGSMHPPIEKASTTKEVEREGLFSSLIWEHFTKEYLGEKKYQLAYKHCKERYKFIGG